MTTAYIVFYDIGYTGDDGYPSSSVDSVFTNEKASWNYIEDRAKDYSKYNITGESRKEKMEWARNNYHIEKYELDIPLDLANKEP